MVAEVREHVASLAGRLGRDKLSAGNLAALENAPRHEFVSVAQRKTAYENRPVPIEHGQTNSQSFIVALMTDLLSLPTGGKVLEVGTGSGYQTAILSLLAGGVFTIEIVAPLGEQAPQTLKRLGYTNVTTRIGDGYSGWRDKAPFDAIIVTATPDHVPTALIEQLKPGGQLVIPVGGSVQDFMAFKRATDGSTASTSLIPVRFVPLTRSND